MDIEKVVNSMQEMFSNYEKLHGTHVSVEIRWTDDKRTRFSFLVPEGEENEANDPDELYLSAMQMLHDQMNLLQDKTIEQGVQADEAAKMREAMCNLASTLRWMASERKQMEREKAVSVTYGGGGGGSVTYGGGGGGSNG